VPEDIGAGASRRKRVRGKHRAGRRGLVLGISLVVLLAAFAAAAIAGLSAASRYVDALPHLDDLQQRKQAENSIVYARDGSPLAILANNQNRLRVPLSRMAPILQEATVAIEDRRFYDHHGVDWQGIARAAVADVRTGKLTQGASTLTQQLVRNLFISNSRSFDRKIKEAWLAMQLENDKQHWTKQKILETYMNDVFYGNNAYGVEAAAQTYFGRHARVLTLPQAALLAGLPQSPSQYDPFSHPKLARARRADVLRALHDQHEITAAAFLKALRAPLGLRHGRHAFGAAKEPFFVQYVRSQLAADPSFGPLAVRTGGLRVRTTIDPALQRLAYDAMSQVLLKPPCKHDPRPSCDPAAAIVSIRPRTGEILAMASTKPFAQSEYDLTAQGQRQPGSTFKPFTLATAIQEGIDPHSTRYLSAPFTCPIDLCAPDPVKGPWHVTTGSYVGPSTIENATWRSDNTVFAQLAVDVGPANIVQTAERLGIRHSNPPLQAVPSITLGTENVSPLDLTTAYATLASQGVYRKPRAIAAVAFAGSRRVIHFRSKGKRVVSDGVAYEVTQILHGNMLHGLGQSAALTPDRPQAGKSGTTEDHADAWFCGFTPDLATCVWMGYPDPQSTQRPPMDDVEGVASVQGPTLPSKIWHLYMTQALASTPPTDWPPPSQPAVYQPFFSQFTQRAVAPPPSPSPKPGKTGTTKTGPAATTGTVAKGP
jgi:penicillin-binding protein 1A